MPKTLIEIHKATMKHLSGSTHSLAIFAFLFLIISAKLFVNRLSLIVLLVATLVSYTRRLNKIKSAVKIIAQGTIKYPTLYNILDSLMIIELIIIFSNWYHFGTYFFRHYDDISIADSIILSSLLSLTLFLMVLMLQQYWLSFFFTSFVSHGFFLCSILPRFIAGTRTILVSFVWYAGIRTFPFFSPVSLHFFYITFKLIFTLMWVYDFAKILLSKDFPQEFKTKIDMNEFQCPICFDNVLFYITLPCGHDFCFQCFSKWGSIQMNCPICRLEFSSWLHQVDFDYLLPLSLVII